MSGKMDRTGQMATTPPVPATRRACSGVISRVKGQGRVVSGVCDSTSGLLVTATVQRTKSRVPWATSTTMPSVLKRSTTAAGMARMAAVVGADHVGLGTDVMGLVGPATFASYAELPGLARALLATGFTADETARCSAATTRGCSPRQCRPDAHWTAHDASHSVQRWPSSDELPRNPTQDDIAIDYGLRRNRDQDGISERA